MSHRDRSVPLSRRLLAPSLALALLSISLPSGTAEAQNVRLAQIDGLSGDWIATTTLVAASKPVAEAYRSGDRRVEVWRIRQIGDHVQLASRAGAIAGGFVAPGVAVLQSLGDTGLGIHTGVRIEAHVVSPADLQGTIRVDYFSSQFGQPVGMDAWTFVATRAPAR
ncbi:hypothetical protein EYW49_06030 [Siculibacillus lacustris]|uniref:DUF1579 domain-containing protein n=1 Tax=Siculibacillus lacustris TaxID=1549641 RepID=A0A4Q9VX07_9HYPH|nr:hypothetical protein [Siculibacillus lacustris]TBW39814.1 hypothetical protein EYW49_06030 [Siculibacillus lacustris]